MFVFNIPGAPTCVFKSGIEGRQPFDTYQENRLRCTITLQNQFENQPIIKKPIDATFKFFLPRTHQYRQKKISIIKLFEFANYIARGRIYSKDCYLYNVTLLKEYSDNPHTEIIIVPIDHVNGGTNETKKRIPKN
jgi:hypothetical protein